jgi:hypothetical protein
LLRLVGIRGYPGLLRRLGVVVERSRLQPCRLLLELFGVL